MALETVGDPLTYPRRGHGPPSRSSSARFYSVIIFWFSKKPYLDAVRVQTQFKPTKCHRSDAVAPGLRSGPRCGNLQRSRRPRNWIWGGRFMAGKGKEGRLGPFSQNLSLRQPKAQDILERVPILVRRKKGRGLELCNAAYTELLWRLLCDRRTYIWCHLKTSGSLLSIIRVSSPSVWEMFTSPKVH